MNLVNALQFQNLPSLPSPNGKMKVVFESGDMWGCKNGTTWVNLTTPVLPYNTVKNILVDFSNEQESSIKVAVTASWVTSSTTLIVSLSPNQTAGDHDPEDFLLEQISTMCSDVVDGVGFNLYVFAPYGTWGRYQFDVLGVK